MDFNTPVFGKGFFFECDGPFSLLAYQSICCSMEYRHLSPEELHWYSYKMEVYTSSRMGSSAEVFAPNNFTSSGMRSGGFDPMAQQQPGTGVVSTNSYYTAQPITQYRDVPKQSVYRFGGVAGTPTQPTYGSNMLPRNNNSTAQQSDFDRDMAEVKASWFEQQSEAARDLAEIRASWSGRANAASTQPGAVTNLFSPNPTTAIFHDTPTPRRSVFGVFPPPVESGNVAGTTTQPAFGSSLFSRSPDTATSDNTTTKSNLLFGGLSMIDGLSYYFWLKQQSRP